MIYRMEPVPRMSRRRTGRNEHERGTAVLEVAMVLPVLMLLLFGIIVFGVDIGLKQSVTHAAAEAAREAENAQLLGSDNGQCAAWTRVATSQVSSALSFLSANNPTVSVTFLPSGQCTGNVGSAVGTTYIQVTVTATSVLKNLPGIGVVAPNQVSSTATVQVQ